ncbi:inositol monophosphatase family protein [Nocardioides caricicola]|uniref:Inositol monophosphatase family protein n=1 Tax=Nocardioides caricicola TaxID=634770 RepID=A0ABW0MYY5_9ACTN
MSASDVAVARAAAEAGAAVIRELYGRPVERFAKSTTDFATRADLDAERAILDVLRSARPEDAVLGEETGLTGVDTGRAWLVDPLCGTKNFAAATPLMAVNVALRTPDGIVAAAVADPVAGEVFATDDVLAPSTASGLVDVDLDHRDFGPLLSSPDFRARFGARVTSTSLALAWVAVGRRAAYVADGDMRDNEHFSAGIALCRAAGCHVSALDGTDVGAGRGVLAAGDAVTHRVLLGLIGDLRPVV